MSEKPERKSRTSQSEADVEAYELDDAPAAPPPPPRKAPPINRSYLIEAGESVAKERPGSSDGITDDARLDSARRMMQSDRPERRTDKPVIPKAVDPAAAARNREEARRKAAAQLAIEHARSRRIKLIVAGVVAAIAVVGGLVWSAMK